MKTFYSLGSYLSWLLNLKTMKQSFPSSRSEKTVKTENVASQGVNFKYISMSIHWLTPSTWPPFLCFALQHGRSDVKYERSKVQHKKTVQFTFVTVRKRHMRVEFVSLPPPLLPHNLSRTARLDTATCFIPEQIPSLEFYCAFTEALMPSEISRRLNTSSIRFMLKKALCILN